MRHELMYLAVCTDLTNPFNPSTTVGFALAGRAEVLLTVYDLLGREAAMLVRGEREAGYHEVRFDASNLPAGACYPAFRFVLWQGEPEHLGTGAPHSGLHPPGTPQTPITPLSLTRESGKGEPMHPDTNRPAGGRPPTLTQGPEAFFVPAPPVIPQEHTP